MDRQCNQSEDGQSPAKSRRRAPERESSSPQSVWTTNGWQKKVIFAKLTRNNVRITNAIIMHPALKQAIRNVSSAGGKILPEWGNGGIMLYPYDTGEMGVEGMMNEHIILAAADLSALGTALLEIPADERPGIMFEEAKDVLDALMSSDSETEPPVNRNSVKLANTSATPHSPEEDRTAGRLGAICHSCGSLGLAGQCPICKDAMVNSNWRRAGGAWLVRTDPRACDGTSGGPSVSEQK